jgi:hypothetical protein
MPTYTGALDPPPRVAADVPLPRRTALVPLVDDVEPVREEDELPEEELPDEDEPLDEEPLEDDEPELEPDEEDPLDGGAERTGCCSEYEGAV